MKTTVRVLIIIAVIAISAVYTTNAQVAINIDGTSADASAMLDVKSADKGLLLPRVADVSAVSNPAAGLMVFDESTNCMRYYNGSIWSECMGRTFACGDALIDPRDGQSYATVQIGTQCWMAENLNVGTMINGSNNQTDNTLVEKYCYDDNTSNCDTYGGLYQWDEMMQYVTTAGTQGVCSEGWHLPTDDEWKTLEKQLGMTTTDADATGYRGADVGSKLAGNEPLWTDGNLDQNANFGASGFTALPGGSQSSGTSSGLTNFGQFWSSTESGTEAWFRVLYRDNTKVSRNSIVKANAYSIRCVRD